MRSNATPTAKGLSFAPAAAAVTAGAASLLPATVDDVVAMGEDLGIRFLTVPGFVRTIPRQWHLDDIIRFGDKVGRAAEAIQLPYVTAIDRRLGIIRAFPEWLLRRVYDLYGPQFGWPAIIDAVDPANEDAAKLEETLKANGRTVKALTNLRERCDDSATLQHIQRTLDYLAVEEERLRAQIESGDAGPAVPA